MFAEEEEEERQQELKSLATELSPRQPICYESYSLCEFARDEKLDIIGVNMLKEMLRFFEVLFGSRDRKKALVARLSNFLGGCECQL